MLVINVIHSVEQSFLHSVCTYEYSHFKFHSLANMTLLGKYISMLQWLGNTQKSVHMKLFLQENVFLSRRWVGCKIGKNANIISPLNAYLRNVDCLNQTTLVSLCTSTSYIFVVAIVPPVLQRMQLAP